MLVNGRWEIVRRLGGGGMGEVHLARDRHQARREVAIKILRAGLADPAAIEGFRAEFQSLARLRHPHLAEVFDFGRVEGSGLPFLTMEYVQGHDLGELRRKEALARFDDLVAQCLRALDYIHARGWLHNDVKPHNIRVTPAFQVKLLDFGLAQRLAAGSEAGASGTLQYLAPERLAGTAPDARSDLYSLGVVLYELLAGRRPYDAPTPGSLVTAILEGAAPAPVTLDHSISERRNRLVVDLMARDPEARPVSSGAAFALLNAGLDPPQPLDTPETFASWVSSGRLVGRESVLETLRLTLAGHAAAVPLSRRPISTRARARGRSALTAGEALAPRVVLISGPPGSGKSRLVREFGQDLQLEGWRTLAGRCHETGGPLQPFADLLRTARAAGSLPAALADVLDSVFGRRARGARVTLDRAEMRAGLASCLDHLAGDGPGVLVLEDLQWADAAGLDLLEHLLLRQERSRWLVIGTLRDTAGAGGAIAGRLARLLERSGLKHLALAPLDAGQTSELLVSMLPFAEPPRELAALLVEKTSGAALHIEEILKGLFAAGLLARRGESWTCRVAPGADLPLPASLAGLVLRQVETLSDENALAARMLAVLARPVPMALLAAALDALPRSAWNVEKTRHAAESLAALHLVTIDWEREGGPWVSLSQATARAAIYGALPAARLRALHRAAAAALVAHYASALDDVTEDLARHYVACDARPEAIEYLLRAAHRAAALHDPVGESAFLKRALTLMPESDAKARLDVYEDLCVALLINLGDEAGGLEIAERMLVEARRAHDPLAEIRALRHQSWALGFLGRDSDALTRGREALGLARRRRARHEIAACLNYIGMTLARGGHHLLAREQFDEAVPMARDEGDPVTLTWMLNNAGISHLCLGDAKTAAKLLTEALEVARRNGPGGLYHRYIGNLGVIRRELGDLTGSIATLEEARAWSRQHTTLELLALQCEALVDSYVPRGRFDLAAAAHAELVRTRALISPNETEPLTSDLAGQIDRGLGRHQAARAAHEAGLAEARRRKDRIQEGYLLAALAADHLAAGEREAARAGALSALDLGRSLAHPRIVFLAELTLARLVADPAAGAGAAAGATAGATAGADERPSPKEIDDLRRRIEAHDEGPLRCVDRLDRHLALGALALAAGDPRAAARAAGAGLAVADRGGFLEHAWRFRVLLARAQDQRGLPRTGTSPYHDAIRQIEAIASEIEDTAMRDDYLKTPERAIAGPPADTSLTGATAARPEPKESAWRMLSTLFEITQVINSIHDPDELLNKVMDLAIDSVGAERGLIFLSPPDGGEMEPVVARNVERQTIKDATAYSQGVLKEAGRGQAVLTHDAEHDARFKEYRSVVRFHIRSLMCVPLSLRGRTIGTVYVDTRAPRVVFTPEHLKFLEAFAAQAAIAVDNANLFDRVRKENENLRQAVSERYGFENIVGRSARMRDVFSILARVAPSPLPVMIRGESGTGKELVARAVHQNSPRRDKAFFSENCAALPDTLLESELFGHVRGAFTGAETSRKGLFELADGGTLFLDEVGDMSMALQSKLLRALQDGEIRPLGAESTRKVNVRVISATNRDLEGMIRSREFREDLYYRLKGISVTLPPLRDRRDDIPLLIDHFLSRLARENDQTRLRVEPALLRELTRREWPGNVRELENAIYRLSLFAEKGVITLDAARNDVDSAEPSPSMAARPVNGSISKVTIRKALTAAKGNRNQAARILGVSRATFFRKMRELGVETARKGH